jgi:hypothetical protein
MSIAVIPTLGKKTACIFPCSGERFSNQFFEIDVIGLITVIGIVTTTIAAVATTLITGVVINGVVCWDFGSTEIPGIAGTICDRALSQLACGSDRLVRFVSRNSGRFTGFGDRWDLGWSRLRIPSGCVFWGGCGLGDWFSISNGCG